MRPIEHLIIAISLAVGYTFLTEHRLPSLKLAAVAFVGSQFPDLIDKPLALQLHLIPTGRVFMHSLPFAVPVWLAVLAYGWKTNRPRGGVVFVLAHASHLLADNYAGLASGRVPSDLLWPFLAPVPRPPAPYWAGPNSINVHLFTAFSVTVLAVTAYYLLADINQRFRLTI